MYKIVINMMDGNEYFLEGLFSTYQEAKDKLREIEQYDTIGFND